LIEIAREYEGLAGDLAPPTPVRFARA
jgi:hypothetical protein